MTQFRFSEHSVKHLATCDVRLQQLAFALIQHVDFRVLEGHRTLARQKELHEQGFTKVLKGKHNEYPSKAFDLLPVPVNLDEMSVWKDKPRFFQFAGFVRGVASELRIPIRHGGDWDSDFNYAEHSFLDLPHFELVE